jgi:3-deoxy-manno-octulosonate cytidylyltransferase (CMP-KDO synthetase)
MMSMPRTSPSQETSSAGKVVAVIPARIGSTRLPRKLLIAVAGRSILQHVWERTCKARSVARVIIATDSEEILSHVREFGGEGVMTSPDHQTGSDRIGEVLKSLPGEIILNVCAA